ncbi:alpha/beta fold hydrolase [Pseudoalteromonas sp. BDTF-M6]|uniref:alpha/beta fold hydrolase n=1 Tax=Pseudoalteromonas sp. BDTF-M6 TaxID=2796132 RepID=UPI001BAECFB4|nr:alpha/beta fold hydrolase [Pseudoalteromonas sp. BDTF-M6]MBS3796847.1 alpha/beta fold hydrolase [Pseudoalteromonas sp. BDTF-M6]
MLLNYEQSGLSIEQAPSVIVIHGLFGSLDNLKVVARALAEHFHVVNVDVRNHGRSFHSEQMDYPAMAADIITLLAHLGIEKAHLVGHSMGGKIAMQVALSKPECVDKLVVLDIAPVAYHSRHDAIFKALHKVANNAVQSRSEADALMSEHIDAQGVRQFLAKSLSKTDSGALGWQFNLPVLTAQYEQILSAPVANDSCLCDTLFIKGADSDYIDSPHRDEIMRLFPKAKAKVIQGAGHWLHAEKPVAVNKSIVDFLTR